MSNVCLLLLWDTNVICKCCNCKCMFYSKISISLCGLTLFSESCVCQIAELRIFVVIALVFCRDVFLVFNLFLFHCLADKICLRFWWSFLKFRDVFLYKSVFALYKIFTKMYRIFFNVVQNICTLPLCYKNCLRSRRDGKLPVCKIYFFNCNFGTFDIEIVSF